MKKTLMTLFALLSLSVQAQQTITVDTKHPGADIAPTMYGIFFEDINFGADGGLYAELVANRSFEAPMHKMGDKTMSGGLLGWTPFGNVSISRDMTIISAIGDLPENNIGFQANILSALKEIPIRMISYGGSVHNISFLIRTKDKEAALNALDKHLF